MVIGQLAGGVHHVGRYDGGHDAPIRYANDLVFCGPEQEAGRGSANGSVRRSLSGIVDGVQRGGSRNAMGAAIGGLGLANDREQVARAQRGAAPHRGRVPIHSAQACVLAGMPLAARFLDERLAQWALRRLAHGDPPWA